MREGGLSLRPADAIIHGHLCVASAWGSRLSILTYVTYLTRLAVLDLTKVSDLRKWREITAAGRLSP